MQAWLNYLLGVFVACIPYMIIIVPMMIFVVRRTKRTQKNQEELIGLQREVVSLLKENIKNQQSIIDGLKAENRK